MKTERRQELKTNDLSALLVDANDWAKKHSARIGTIAVVAAVIILAYVIVKRSRASATDAAWQQMHELQFTPELAEESFDTLDALIESASDRDFKMKALLRKGLQAMVMAEGVDQGFNPQYLDEAEAAYKAILEQFPDRMPAKATALRALATIEQSRFVVDHDMAHKEKCKTYLNQLVNDPEFRETTYQTDAARQLAALDQYFRVVELAEPAPLPPAVIAPGVQVDQPFELQTRPSDGAPPPDGESPQPAPQARAAPQGAPPADEGTADKNEDQPAATQSKPGTTGDDQSAPDAAATEGDGGND